MGCIHSKKQSAGKDCGDGYATIGVEKFDEIFTKAAGISERASGLKEGLESGKMTVFKHTGMQWVKEPTLTSALQCWVYASSADVSDPSEFKPELKMETPFVDLPEDLPLSEQNKSAKTAIQEYIRAIAEAPETLKAMTEEFQGVVDAANAAKDTAAEDFGSLSMMDKAKATKNLGANMKKLLAAQEEISKLPETLKQTTEDLQKALAALPEALANSKETVEKTKEKNATTADLIAKEILPGDKNDEVAAKKFAELHFGGVPPATAAAQDESTVASDKEAEPELKALAPPAGASEDKEAKEIVDGTEEPVKIEVVAILEEENRL